MSLGFLNDSLPIVISVERRNGECDWLVMVELLWKARYFEVESQLQIWIQDSNHPTTIPTRVPFR